MTAQLFKDDDTGFVHWQEAHPYGYILNAQRNPKPSYLMLHRADCVHLDTSSDRRWTDQYIKVCSIDVKDLLRWAETTVSGYRGMDACKTCDP